ncbi:RagB/SusD family nutrient uptake outer membrane protein [Larkinella sp. GY13]|uniref:RagB/SusD family nutrient uptake outer membrane protein n=1 Tax=Larkinella sp. GY13 TaxID=3453720 RepID=UPI003EE9CCD1
MKKIVSLLVVLVCTMSCSKDFIERNPISTVSTEVLYKTDKDFQDAVIGIYQPFQPQYMNFWQLGDLPGDDTEQQHSAAFDLVNMNNFILNSSLNILSTSWLNYYQIIFRANTVLSNIEKADVAVVTRKDRHIGEAKFLRAMAYFDLVRLFGDVPLLSAPISALEAAQKGRDKVDAIYDELIIKDLIEAEAKLPEKYTGVDVGRATKGAARALLGKVYLTRKDFVKAEAKLKEVTTMGYALLPNFNDLWDYTKDEHHSEYIYDIEYVDGGQGLGSTFSNAFAPNLSQIINFFGLRGAGGQNGSPTEGLFSLYAATDKRKAISVSRVIDGLVDKNGTFIPMVPIDATTYTRKYMTTLINPNDSKANWKVIRYADVLLMYAEALNENGKTTEALTTLNLVRTRAGVPVFTGLAQTETRDKIYTERRLELYLEGHRWFDLVRTGRALTVLQTQGIKSYMTVFPIPLNQIQVINNPTIFPQNPGYD